MNLKEILDITLPWELTPERQKKESIKQYWKDATEKYNIIFSNGKNYVTFDGIRVTLDSDSENIIERLFELRKKYTEDKFFEIYGESVEIYDPEWCGKIAGNR